eukprot:SAG11_NODE_2146_length_3752_cov_8.634373_1_plen_71_part_00
MASAIASTDSCSEMEKKRGFDEGEPVVPVEPDAGDAPEDDASLPEPEPDVVETSGATPRTKRWHWTTKVK